MTFKNQRTAYVSLRALTTNANEGQDLRGYWTKVHPNLYRHRGIIVHLNATVGVAHPLLNAGAQNEDSVCQFSPTRATNRLP